MIAEEDQPRFCVKLLTNSAIPPIRTSEGAAGYDLSSAVDCVVPKHGKYLVATDLAMAIPQGYFGHICPRSGIALKNFIDVGAGIIDYDYRGPVGVLLFNHSEEDFIIKKGNRIAQLVLVKITLPKVEEVNELPETVRQNGGFGSTGI